VATAEAMVSGLAPGKPAFTEMVGKSTWGSGDTGSNRKATAPASAMATMMSVVAIGLRMNGSEKFMVKSEIRKQKSEPRLFFFYDFYFLISLPFFKSLMT
jgi:hypothetical protein